MPGSDRSLAVEFQQAVEFNKNTLFDTVLEAVATGSEPSSPVIGMLVYNSTESTLEYYTSAGWKTIKDISIDQFAAAMGAVDMNSYKIVKLATPTTGTDAANKDYVDNMAVGLKVKESCHIASHADSNWTSAVTIGYNAGTGILTLSNLPAGTTYGLLDGKEPVNDERILLKDAETAGGLGGAEDAIYNGIWVVTGGTTTSLTMSRADDFDDTPDTEVTGGAFTFVMTGDNWINSGWVVSHDGNLVVGTDDVNWVQFSGAGLIVAGDALSKIGNTLNVEVGGGIVVTADKLVVDVGNGLELSDGTDSAKVTIKPDTTDDTIDVDASGVKVKDLSLKNGKVATDADITRTKLAPGTADYVVINDGSGEMSEKAQSAFVEDNAIQSEESFVLNPVNSGVASADNKSWTVTHSFNSRDLDVIVKKNSGSYERIFVYWDTPTSSTIDIEFGDAIVDDTYKITVTGKKIN